jgi:hypothetical protein
MSTGAIWLVIPLILDVCLAVLLVRRGTYRSFPLFFAYVVFSAIAEITRSAFPRNQLSYFYAYWVTETLYAALGFLAIAEAFNRVFQHLYSLRWFRLVLPSVSVLMVALSIIYGVFFPPIQADPWLATIFVAEIAVRSLQGAIFCVFALLVRLDPIRPQSYPIGIAMGFAVSALGSFLTFFLRSVFGTKLIPVIQFIAPVAYILAVVIWLAFFLRPELPNPYRGVKSPLSPEQAREILRRYKEQAKDLFKWNPSPC